MPQHPALPRAAGCSQPPTALPLAAAATHSLSATRGLRPAGAPLGTASAAGAAARSGASTSSTAALRHCSGTLSKRGAPVEVWWSGQGGCAPAPDGAGHLVPVLCHGAHTAAPGGPRGSDRWERDPLLGEDKQCHGRVPRLGQRGSVTQYQVGRSQNWPSEVSQWLQLVHLALTTTGGSSRGLGRNPRGAPGGVLRRSVGASGGSGRTVSCQDAIFDTGGDVSAAAASWGESPQSC